MSTVPAAIVLAGLAAAALLADRLVSVAAIAALLLAVCLRAPRGRRRLYLFGALSTGAGVFALSPLFSVAGGGAIVWIGPTVPVLGSLDVTTSEIAVAGLNGLRLVALALAFSAYALLLDHDRLVAAAAWARRSAIAVALATRLVPTLERDAVALADSVRGRGVPIEGARGYASLLSPLVAGSLERASSLAEAMEARGFGRPGATRAPRAPWTARDRVAVALAGAVACIGALWL